MEKVVETIQLGFNKCQIQIVDSYDEYDNFVFSFLRFSHTSMAGVSNIDSWEALGATKESEWIKLRNLAEQEIAKIRNCKK